SPFSGRFHTTKTHKRSRVLHATLDVELQARRDRPASLGKQPWAESFDFMGKWRSARQLPSFCVFGMSSSPILAVCKSTFLASALRRKLKNGTGGQKDARLSLERGAILAPPELKSTAERALALS